MPSIVICALAIASNIAVAATGGTSWQGLNASALITHGARTFAVVHGSTLNIPRNDKKRVQNVGLCRTGILDNCALGLSKLRPAPRSSTEKCAVLTGKSKATCTSVSVLPYSRTPTNVTTQNGCANRKNTSSVCGTCTGTKIKQRIASAGPGHLWNPRPNLRTSESPAARSTPTASLLLSTPTSWKPQLLPSNLHLASTPLSS